MEGIQQGAPLGAFYEFAEKVGSGAMGEVWTVTHSLTGETRAAKVLHPEHGRDPKLVERFIHERSLLLSLHHRGIARVRDLVVEADRLAIVMDYEPGGTLSDYLSHHSTLKPSAALQAATQVFDALAYAHEHGIAHRDVKPENVLLSQRTEGDLGGILRVTDFGIASLTESATRHSTGIIGTPYYLSPESITTGVTGGPADVYATGIMLYELMAGRTPFAGPGTDFAIAYRHVSSQPPRLDLPLPLWQELMVLLSKNPEERPSAAEAAGTTRALAKKYQDLGALAPLPEPMYFDEAEKPSTAHRGIVPDASGNGSRTEDAVPSEAVEAAPQESPELGDAGQKTIVRPIARPDIGEPQGQEPSGPEEKSGRPDWLTNKVLWMSGAGLILVLAVVAALIWGPGMNKDKPKESFTAQGEPASPLPSGLSVQRSAEYDPNSGTARLKITYSAQKADLSGDFLEVIPDAGGGSCPSVDWEGASAQRNQVSVTGLEAKCGWQLKDLKVPANDSTEVTARIHMDSSSEKDLKDWVKAVGDKTEDATTNEGTHSTAYPAQRLTDIQVKAPDRAVNQSSLNISLYPVWPSGPDTLNPLFVSPSKGEPSKMLSSISSADQGVHFTDGCAGNTVVSKDGKSVTALSVAPQCSVNASVGNFTDLQSNQFSITARGK
ncbi:serine/threonine-protein kinase [Curtobacterium sp. S6]|uniref:serine/threonine-protein kinase n=1 Tax=Curtobacterium sp. S6 TaxID=1479623 RepID=UPI0004AB6F64|nr:serine/threonine-protein kinase [Curtobacterium sp. S6]